MVVGIRLVAMSFALLKAIGVACKASSVKVSPKPLMESQLPCLRYLPESPRRHSTG